MKEHLTVLGLCHEVGVEHSINFKSDGEAKLRGRLHAIAQLPISQTRRRALVMQLATPMFTWAAGMVKWDAAVLSNLRADVCRAIQGPGLVDTPHPIALEMVGWSFEAAGAMMAAIIKAAICCQARHPRWAAEIAMDFALQKCCDPPSCCAAHV